MDICKAAEELTHGHYPYLCYYKIVISAIGLITLLFAIKKEGFAWLCHPNAKVLFVSSVTTTLLSGVFRICLYVYEVLRIHRHVSQICDLLLPETVSFFLRIPSPLIGSIETFILLCFAIERTISALLLHRYEKIKKPYGGIAALVLSILLPTFITYIFIIRPNKYENQTIAPCVATEDNSTYYKVRENLSIIPMLLPCFYIHAFLMLIIALILFCYVEFTETFYPPTLIVLTEYVNQAPLYTILLALTIMARRRFYRVTPVVVDRSMLGHVYFMELQNQWNPAS